MVNIFRTWWKVRKYFKFPDIYVYFGNTYCVPINTYSVDVGYRKSNNKIWVNYNPQININIFGIFQLYIELRKSVDNTDISNVYWTALLNYLYCVNLKDAIDDALTLIYDENVNLVKNSCLTKKGKKKYENMCNK
mgnify:CR=1 FL=1